MMDRDPLITNILHRFGSFRDYLAWLHRAPLPDDERIARARALTDRLSAGKDEQRKARSSRQLDQAEDQFNANLSPSDAVRPTPRR
jgi:hypothetical protein